MKRLLRLPLLVTAGLLCANLAPADTIISLTDISTADLSSEIQALFGSSGPYWTTDSNIAEIDYLMSVATSLGTDPNSELSASAVASILEQEDASGTLPLDALLADQISAENPEPVTLVLLAGGLILLAGWAVKCYGARQKAHRSDGD